MERSQLSGKIAELVDCLRSNDEKSLELTDVAAVTEVLIGTMESYFRSIDTKIYHEFRELTDYIDTARTEIAELVPSDIKTSRLPRAGMELDAIVQSTEQATNGIMEAAEAIMNVEAESVEGYKDAIEEHCMRIFEECSFQDITGQRISKVVETLEHIENRIHALKDIWGVDEERATAADSDADLMRGPALANEGIDQSEIDTLLDGDGDSAPAAPASDDATPAPAEAAASAGDARSADAVSQAGGHEAAAAITETTTAETTTAETGTATAPGEAESPKAETEESVAAAEAPVGEHLAADAPEKTSAPEEKVTERRIEPSKRDAAKDKASEETGGETEEAEEREPEPASSNKEATQAEIDALFS